MTKWQLVMAVVATILMTQGCVEATYRGHLEVWNLTQREISIIGREATVMVPACGHIQQDGFVLNRYDIVDDNGRFIARHGGGGSDPVRVAPAYEVITRDGALYSDSAPPPKPLPECVGTIQGQEP